MANQKLRITIVLCAAALVAAGCAYSGAPRTEAAYGDATRSNIRVQLYNPDTAIRPSDDVVEGTDGQRMEAVMEAHRNQAGSAESVSNPIVINVGD